MVAPEGREEGEEGGGGGKRNEPRENGKGQLPSRSALTQVRYGLV